MQGTTHVIAGECTTDFRGADSRAQTQRGAVVVVVKPDNTVLVHDADGYQPVAWLTRAERVTMADDTLTATDGDQRLDVEIHRRAADARHRVTPAGRPVGTCPDCDCPLVRAGGAVHCFDCDAEWGIPGDATVLEDVCECGLPRMAVTRGERFEVCLDRGCESLDAAVQAALDGRWDCPNCDADLVVVRRGGLLLGCSAYPDCETGFALPAGTVTGECDCGLPRFETGSGRRCLDTACRA
jgi:DNA topoisomerase-1